MLDGFTIQGGLATSGGGILCDSSSPTISNCTISGNMADGGGGIYCAQSSPIITNCTISDNWVSWQGGGIRCDGSPALITNCTISGNMANGGGGGIDCYGYPPTVTNCTISGNSASWGGGIYLNGSSPSMTNCIINGNTADDGGGVYCNNSSPPITNCTITSNSATQNGGGIYCGGNSPPGVFNIVNSILWGDTVGGSVNEIYLDGTTSIHITYSDIEEGWEGTGNIDADPLFVGGGDYHLTASSPCIDTGTSVGAPPDDIDGDARPQGSGYDMGSDEYAYLTISTDKSLYFTDNTMKVSLQTRVEIPPIVADVYIRIVLPGGAPTYYYPAWSTTPTPVVSSWTVTDWGPAVFFSHTFSGIEPGGEYTWQAALTEPGTYNIIGEISFAPFTFSP